LKKKGIARQRLGKNVLAATNTYATTEDLVGAVFSMQSASYKTLKGDKKM
jgi:hypothetical protein